VLLECFGSSEYYKMILKVRSEKIEFGYIFDSPVAFSDRSSLVGLLSHGAGELGPLGATLCVNLNEREDNTMRKIQIFLVGLLLVVAVHPQQAAAKSTLSLTLKTGQKYHEIQLISLQPQSLTFWAYGDTLQVKRNAIYSMEMHRPNRGGLGFIIGGVLGCVVGASEAHNTTGVGEGIVAPAYPAWYGIFGGLIGEFIGLFASRDYTYHLAEMEPAEAQESLEWLMQKFQLQPSGT